jgi:hypothetical protein
MRQWCFLEIIKRSSSVFYDASGVRSEMGRKNEKAIVVFLCYLFDRFNTCTTFLQMSFLWHCLYSINGAIYGKLANAQSSDRLLANHAKPLWRFVHGIPSAQDYQKLQISQVSIHAGAFALARIWQFIFQVERSLERKSENLAKFSPARAARPGRERMHIRLPSLLDVFA